MMEWDCDRVFVRNQEEKFEVRQGKVAYVVGGVIVGVGVGLLVLEFLYHIGRIPVWVYLVILAICGLGVSVWMEAKNRRLLVEGEWLDYRNMVGVGKRFEWKAIGYVKVADDFSKGRDYLKLYDKEGKRLCRLECSMQNAEALLVYLHDRGIRLEGEKGNGNLLKDILAQQVIGEEELGKISEEVYEKTRELVNEWMKENRVLGADFSYGFVENSGEWVTRQENYLCRLVLYVKKEGCPVRNRKGRLLMMNFFIFYKRRTGVIGENERLYYNKGWQEEMENVIKELAEYLSKHRFYKEEGTLDLVLKERV